MIVLYFTDDDWIGLICSKSWICEIYK